MSISDSTTLAGLSFLVPCSKKTLLSWLWQPCMPIFTSSWSLLFQRIFYESRKTSTWRNSSSALLPWLPSGLKQVDSMYSIYTHIKNIVFNWHWLDLLPLRTFLYSVNKTLRLGGSMLYFQQSDQKWTVWLTKQDIKAPNGYIKNQNLLQPYNIKLHPISTIYQ